MTAEEIKKKIRSREPGLIEVRKESAVLLPLVETEEGLSVLYEKRTGSISHAGETCFPGGVVEEGETPLEAMKREVLEEIGLREGCDYDLYGKFGDFYLITGMHLNIYVAGLLPGALERIKKQDSEVDEVFTIPLVFLTGSEPMYYRYRLLQEYRDDFPYGFVGVKPDYRLPNGKVNMPIWEYRGHVLWGMTARMTMAFLQAIVLPGESE